MKKGFINTVILIIIAVVLTTGVALYYYNNFSGEKLNESEPTVNQDYKNSPTSSPTTVEEGVNGYVDIKLGFPSEFLPTGVIYAKNIETYETIEFPVEQNITDYMLELPVGSYYFKYEAQVDPNDPLTYLDGFLTTCSQESLNCQEDSTHELISIEILENQTTEEINISDFYYTPDNKPEF